VPAHPSGEGRLEQNKALESVEGKMMRSCPQGVGNGEMKLNIWPGFRFSRAALGRNLDQEGKALF